MTRLLRVGVIGLGSRWRRRYLPALQALREEFEVRAVYDQVRERAVRVARQLGCGVSVGPGDLLESRDIEALLLLDPQWFGLWPVERACRVRKPVFCATPLGMDEANLEKVAALVRAEGLPVQAGLIPRASPGTVRLRTLLETRLGQPRVAACDLVQPLSANQSSPPEDLFLGAASLPLLDWCVGLMGESPSSVWATSADEGRFSTLLLEFPGQRLARITRWRAPRVRSRWRLRLVAEHGIAGLDLPGRLRWTDDEGRHLLALGPNVPAGVALLRQFHEALTRGQALQPGLDNACQVRRWLMAAVQSRASGQRVSL